MKEPILSKPTNKNYRSGYDGINWTSQQPKQYCEGECKRHQKKVRATFKSIISLANRLAK